jgi:transposase, IS30 family
VTYKQLTSEERYNIAAMRQQGCSAAATGVALGRHPSTIYRELKRNGTPYDGAYRPSMAIEMTNGRRRRSRRNARYGPRHFRRIETLLRRDWSPAQVVGSIRRNGRHVMSHETVYLWIWADKARGGSLWKHLRGACKRRRKRYGRNDSRGRLAGKRPIQDRPAIVERRGRFGDWEGDTVHGRGKPCVVTTVERKSGFVRIGALPRATVAHTNERIVELLGREPHPVRTITTDNGVEFHGYRDVERELDTTVYFATPHHAWERGTSENTNGLIRQYLPKGTHLGHLTQADCDRIAAKLNARPRKRLGFRTPHQIYYGSVRRTRR